MRILKKSWIVIVLLLGMVICWIMQLKGTSMPIWHKASIVDGRFETRIGEVRELRLKSSQKAEGVTVYLSIYDEAENVRFEKEYRNLTLKSEYITVETFSKEQPLQLGRGIYTLKIDSPDDIELSGGVLEYSGNFLSIYVKLAILLIAASGIILWMADDKRKYLELSFFIMFIVLSFLYNYIQPPFGVADEQSHFLEAYKLSSQILLQESCDQEGRVLVRSDILDEGEYLHDISTIAGWHSGTIADSKREIVSSNVQSTVTSRGKYCYLPAAFGIAIARIFHWNAHGVLVTGRFFNAMAVAAIIALAIYLVQKEKLLMITLGLIPETIYLSMSYSYDGINYALCLLIVAYFIHLYNSERIRLRQIGILTGICLAMIPIKTVYCTWAILILLLPWKKVELSRLQKIISGIGFCIIALGASVIILPNIVSLLGGSYTANSDKINLAYMMQNPFKILSMYYYTFITMTTTYLNNMMGEIVGRARENGLDCYSLPIWLVAAFILIIIVAMGEVKQNVIGRRKKILVLCIGMITSMGILLSILFDFTTVDGWRILGIQGRYFLPIMTLIPLLFNGKRYEIRMNNRMLCIAGCGVVNVIYVFFIFIHYATNFFV